MYVLSIVKMYHMPWWWVFSFVTELPAADNSRIYHWAKTRVCSSPLARLLLLSLFSLISFPWVSVLPWWNLPGVVRRGRVQTALKLALSSRAHIKKGIIHEVSSLLLLLLKCECVSLFAFLYLRQWAGHSNSVNDFQLGKMEPAEPDEGSA